MPETDNNQALTSPGVTQPSVVVMPEGIAQAPAPAQVVAQAAVQPVEQPQEQSQQQPTPLAPEQPQLSDEPSGDGIAWTASEFVAHQKSGLWYVGLVGATIVLTSIVYFFTRDLISVVALLTGAAVFWYFAARQPRQLQYQLDDHGLGVGQRHYSYDDFRSFALVQEGAFSSIIFTPLKRFAPLTIIYFAPENEDQIVDLLSLQLPFEEYHHDMVDRLMQRIRF